MRVTYRYLRPLAVIYARGIGPYESSSAHAWRTLGSWLDQHQARKRVKQSLERTLCAPCPYCQGAGMVKSAQTMCFEILEQAKAMSKQAIGNSDVMLRVSPNVAEAFRASERAVLEEIEAYFGTPVTLEADPNLHQEQYDFAVM